MSWFASLSWSHALMLACICWIAALGVYLIICGWISWPRQWPKRPEVIKRNRQFRDA